MKKLFLLPIMILALVGCGQTGPMGPQGAQGSKGDPGSDAMGNINSNTTWTTNNTYVIERNTVVKNGVTLTLEPGCTVSLNPGVYIYVDGTINAQGTPDKHIVFKKEGTGPGGFVNFTTSSLNNFLRYCEFQDQSLVIDSSSSDIQYCKLICTNNCYHGWGITLFSNTTSLSSLSFNISNCTFLGNGTARSVGVGLTAQITGTFNNCIFNGLEQGLMLISTSAGSTLSMNGCSIINNSVLGIDAAGIVTITNSNLYSNTMNYINRLNDQNATHNWWGTTDTAMIDQKIEDKNDVVSRGTVNYSGCLSAAVNVTGCGW